MCDDERRGVEVVEDGDDDEETSVVVVVVGVEVVVVVVDDRSLARPVKLWLVQLPSFCVRLSSPLTC